MYISTPSIAQPSPAQPSNPTFKSNRWLLFADIYLYFLRAFGFGMRRTEGLEFGWYLRLAFYAFVCECVRLFSMCLAMCQMKDLTGGFCLDQHATSRWHTRQEQWWSFHQDSDKHHTLSVMTWSVISPVYPLGSSFILS